MQNSIPFSPPDITDSEINNVVDSLKSGWITTGPKTKEFEKQISEYCGTEKTVCLNSATAAMEMTLRLLGIGKGDEIITSAYTYTATCSVICHVGAIPILVDVQKDSYEMDYDKLESLITEKTKMIIPVEIAGVICDYDKIFDIVNRKKDLFKASNELQEKINRIIVMSDSAHAFGAVRKNKKAGSIADFTSFSFHAVKNLTTAEGGAITWKSNSNIDNEFIYKRYQILSLHGQTKDAFSKTKLGAWEYDILEPAYKCNMTDIQSAIGLAQLSRYDEMLKRRHEIIKRYNEVLIPMGVKVLPHVTDDSRSSGHLYLTRVPNITLEQRSDIIVKMAEKGIATNVHYKPLPLLTAYKNMGLDISNYPEAYAQYENEITLPLYTKLTDEQVGYIIQNYKEIVEEYIK